MGKEVCCEGMFFGEGARPRRIFENGYAGDREICAVKRTRVLAGIAMSCRDRVASWILTVLAATMLAGAGQAENLITAKEVLDHYGSGAANEKAMVAGILLQTEQGMEWMQTYFEIKRNQKRAFCPPEKPHLTGEQILDIMRREIGRAPQFASKPYEAVLLTSLQSVFPCP